MDVGKTRPPAEAGGHFVSGGEPALTHDLGAPTPRAMARSKDAIERAWQNQEANDPTRASNKVRLLQTRIDELDALAKAEGIDGRAPMIYHLIDFFKAHRKPKPAAKPAAKKAKAKAKR